MRSADLPNTAFPVRFVGHDAGFFIELCDQPDAPRRVPCSPLHLYLVVHGKPCDLKSSDPVRLERDGNEVRIVRPCDDCSDGMCRVSVDAYCAALASAYGIAAAA